MSAQASTAAGQSATAPGRLFTISCLALTAVAFNFAAIAGAMFGMRETFGLSNAAIGWIGGAGLWGIAVAQLAFAPLCDALGARRLMWLALAGHVVGALIMMSASGFSMLFAGALTLSIANGVIEAACNPVVATLYPDRKAVMLNRFHLFFPGGIALGGLLIYAIGLVGFDSWRLIIAITLLPTLLYGALLIGATFPSTEVRSAGLTVGQTLGALVRSPLLWLLALGMAVTASLELGPNRWIPAVLEAGGMAGILVLVLINGIMAAMRAFAAGPILARIPPTLYMAISCLLAALGLWMLSRAGSQSDVLIAAIVFAFGIALMWPTMIGLVAERVPQSGAVGLGLLATVGSAVVGLVTTPYLGALVDARIAAAGALDAAAESRAGLEAFASLVPFAIAVAVMFLIIYWRDRRAGGYAATVRDAREKMLAMGRGKAAMPHAH